MGPRQITDPGPNTTTKPTFSIHLRCARCALVDRHRGDVVAGPLPRVAGQRRRNPYIRARLSNVRERGSLSRRRLVTVVLLVSGVIFSGVGWVLLNRRLNYGTWWAERIPPKVSRCGRDWLRGLGTGPPRGVAPSDLKRVGATPGGADIVSDAPGCGVLPPTVIWVRTNADSYAPYALSGGP